MPTDYRPNVGYLVQRLIVGSDVWRPRLIGNGFAVSLLAIEEPTRAIEHSVDLARHDEIVLVQSLDFLGAQRDGRVTPVLPENHIRA
jgi:hypothetical protein